MLKYLKQRLEERATWTGIGAALTATVTAVASLQLSPLAVHLLTAGIALSGIAAVLVPSPPEKAE